MNRKKLDQVKSSLRSDDLNGVYGDDDGDGYSQIYLDLGKLAPKDQQVL